MNPQDDEEGKVFADTRVRLSNFFFFSNITILERP